MVLDLCCGQGNVAEALAIRGCNVTGADFSPAMLELARRRCPDAAFIEADAQDLPFRDGQFDVVVSNVGVCHVPDQRRALAEAKRVLRHGGRFGMTVWCGPDRSPSYELVYRAIKTYGAAGIAAPPGPDFHQFADRTVANEFLSGAGFSDIRMSIVESGWTVKTPEAFFDIFARGTVRAAMLLARQPPDNLAAIRSALSEEVRRRFVSGSQWRVPTMAAISSATA
jgi:SAM-dependent methyltransferase